MTATGYLCDIGKSSSSCEFATTEPEYVLPQDLFMLPLHLLDSMRLCGASRVLPWFSQCQKDPSLLPAIL